MSEYFLSQTTFCGLAKSYWVNAAVVFEKRLEDLTFIPFLSSHLNNYDIKTVLIASFKHTHTHTRSSSNYMHSLNTHCKAQSPKHLSTSVQMKLMFNRLAVLIGFSISLPIPLKIVRLYRSV